MGGRTVQQLANDMCKILSIMPHRHAPMLPRVLLMGSRGSGVTTQAEKLVQKYGMIHGSKTYNVSYLMTSLI